MRKVAVGQIQIRGFEGFGIWMAVARTETVVLSETLSRSLKQRSYLRCLARVPVDGFELCPCPASRVMLLPRVPEELPEWKSSILIMSAPEIPHSESSEAVWGSFNVWDAWRKQTGVVCERHESRTHPRPPVPGWLALTLRLHPSSRGSIAPSPARKQRKRDDQLDLGIIEYWGGVW